MQFRSDLIKSGARFMVTSDSATTRFFASVGGYFYNKCVFIPFSSTVYDYTHSEANNLFNK